MGVGFGGSRKLTYEGRSNAPMGVPEDSVSSTKSADGGDARSLSSEGDGLGDAWAARGMRATAAAASSPVSRARRSIS